MPESHAPLFPHDSALRAFTAGLNTAAVGRSLHAVASTASTNDLALDAARRGALHGSVFFAERQTAGRGRRGRVWEAPPHRSLLFSVLLRTDGLEPGDLGWLPLLAGLAVRNGVGRLGLPEPLLKWPNDLLYSRSAAGPLRHAKAGGILCESLLPPGDGKGGHVVIGIGLNVNQTADELPPLAKAPPTSVALQAGRPVERGPLFAAVLQELERQVLRLMEPGGRAQLQAELTAVLKLWAPPWCVLDLQAGEGDAARHVSGRFAGLDPYGRLLLERLDGECEALADAEVLALR